MVSLVKPLWQIVLFVVYLSHADAEACSAGSFLSTAEWFSHVPQGYTWSDAESLCTSLGLTLGTLDDYCGPAHDAPAIALNDEHDEDNAWVPFAQDGENAWVNLVAGYGKEECYVHHTDSWERPDWGESQGEAKAKKFPKIMCHIDKCIECPPHTYSETDNSFECTPCPDGSLLPGTANTDGSGCTPCPAGKFAWFPEPTVESDTMLCEVDLWDHCDGGESNWGSVGVGRHGSTVLEKMGRINGISGITIRGEVGCIVTLYDSGDFSGESFQITHLDRIEAKASGKCVDLPWFSDRADSLVVECLGCVRSPCVADATETNSGVVGISNPPPCDSEGNSTEGLCMLCPLNTYAEEEGTAECSARLHFSNCKSCWFEQFVSRCVHCQNQLTHAENVFVRNGCRPVQSSP